MHPLLHQELHMLKCAAHMYSQSYMQFASHLEISGAEIYICRVSCRDKEPWIQSFFFHQQAMCCWQCCLFKEALIRY